MQSDKTKQLCVDLAQFMSSVEGNFEFKYEQLWGSTFGMNLKGRMENEKFQKFVLNFICNLFPDALEEPGL